MRLPRITPLVGSVALHVLAAGLLLHAARTPPKPVPQKPVEVAVIEKRPEPPPPPPPPKEEPKPAPKPPPRPSKVAKVPPKPLPPPPVNAPPPPPDKAPPPPTVEAKAPTQAPVVMPGITMESTTSGGSFAVNTGNTLYGDPGKTGRAPGTAKPYKAERYASSAQVTDLPSCQVPSLKEFYPVEAQRMQFEGEVVLKLLIDSDGSIAKVDVVSDPGQGLGAAALKMVKSGKIRCSAARVNGQAVATTVPFHVTFTLD